MQIVPRAIRNRLALSAVVVLAVALSLLAAAAPHITHAAGAEIIVTTTADTDDPGDGSCSLREAIIASNTNANYQNCTGSGAFGVNDQIHFVLTIGIETPIINIGATPLPVITEWVTIDGGVYGTERVEIHGPGAPAVGGNDGFIIANTGAGTTIQSMVINNFGDDGVLIQADEVTLLNNFIGTDELGLTAEPNLGFGVQAYGNGDAIGPKVPTQGCPGLCGNLISGNKKAGILLDNTGNGGPVSTGAFVRGNFIGTDRTGGAGLANELGGIQDKGVGTIIGGQFGLSLDGSCTGNCNVISGNNGGPGILLDALATESLVVANFIGVDVVGQSPVGNFYGIETFESHAHIGGSTPEGRNIISGNTAAGVRVAGGAGAIIQGNYIGTNTDGSAAVSGSGSGIMLAGGIGVIIGGSQAGEGNLISGANGFGAGIEIFNSVNAQIDGNRIGTAADGNSPLPNFDGIFMYNVANGSEIGSAAANTIAFNGNAGVDMDGDDLTTVRGNTIHGNSIYSNGQGIELKRGANDDLAAPVILSKEPLSGTSCAMCNIDIYSDDEDQGRVYEGTVFTPDGNWTYSGSLTGPNVTATATDVSHNTSEFSTPFVIFTATPSPTPAVSELVQGDVNCDDAIDVADFELIIEYVAGVNDGVTPGGACPDLGMASPAGPALVFQWGDIDCSGTVDAYDALFPLEHAAGIDHLLQFANCTPLGEHFPAER
ncbi:MAG: CSLREA domain-containing protein [Chloroflexota bacterium]